MGVGYPQGKGVGSHQVVQLGVVLARVACLILPEQVEAALLQPLPGSQAPLCLWLLVRLQCLDGAAQAPFRPLVVGVLDLPRYHPRWGVEEGSNPLGTGGTAVLGSKEGE